MRRAGWDYSAPAAYFVTICVRHKRGSLCEIVRGTPVLSEAGFIVAEEWQRTEAIRHHVQLDAWVVMPDHFHGVIRLLEPASPPSVPAISRLVPGSLGAIIGQFKAACTRRIRAAFDPTFAWQRRFHDHIIHDHADLHRIRTYINANPARWNAPASPPGGLPVSPPQIIAPSGPGP